MSRACINFNILLDFTLTRKEIALYGIIENMESDGKHVFYNNATLAKMLDVGEESKMVSRMCRNLKSKGYITREHKQIPMKRKNETVMVWRWCWNTVKVPVITDIDDEDFENDNQGGVLPSHPTGVLPIHPQGVPPVHPYTSPLTLPPLKTTTTCSSSFNPFETKCLEFKHSTDDRTPDEFLENVHHHIKLNSDPDAGEYQRQQMILKLLRTLHQSAAHFKSKGYVSTVEKEQKKKIETGNNMERMRNQWLNYYNSLIEQDCRKKGYKTKTFEEWIETYVSSQS